MEFKNASNLKFVDISSEEYRVYKFSDQEIRIDGPLQLNVSKSGGHRLFDSAGQSHYVASGWRQITWKAKQGQPHFVT